MQNFALILRGVSGSGKSTYAKKIKALLEKNGYSAVVCEADDFFVKDGVYKIDISKLEQAHNQCFDKFNQALKEGCVAIVSNTNTELWEFDRYLKAANKLGAKSFVVRLKTKEDLIKKRVGENRKAPPASVERQYGFLKTNEYKNEISPSRFLKMLKDML